MGEGGIRRDGEGAYWNIVIICLIHCIGISVHFHVGPVIRMNTIVSMNFKKSE